MSATTTSVGPGAGREPTASLRRPNGPIPSRPVRSELSTAVEAVAALGRDRADAAAVHDDRGVLTFGELDALVGSLASDLRERTGGADVTVPLLVGPDRAAAIAFHGVFRAGLTAAPLDPALPPLAQRELWVRLGRPSWVVVAEAGAASALDADVHEIVVPDRPVAVLPPRPVDRAAPAVVIFTSGSTGRPKGVVLPWSVLDAVRAQMARASAGPAEVCHARTPPMHWIGGVRCLLELTVGHTIAVTRPHPAPEALFAWWSSVGATDVMVPPSTAHALARAVPVGRRLETVTTVSAGNGGTTWDHIRSVRRLFADDARFFNGYGSTELGGVMAVQHWVEPGDDGDGPIPLGRPTLDCPLRTVPLGDGDGGAGGDGVLAELVVGAAGRYLDDPVLEAERFEVAADGTRWWHTGDLVRVDPDGLLHGAGRTDDVVKVNGVLVAPSEAEAVLRGLPGIRHAAVVPYETERGPRLAAHLQVDPDADLTPESVRSACAAQLAPSVVPHVFVRHDELPTVGAGKADRPTLRATPITPWRTVPVRPSRSSVENWCLATARQITGIDDIAPDDDLLLAGLDSLGILEFCRAIEDVGFGRIEPNEFLTHRRVAELALTLGRRPAIDPSPVTVLNGDGRRAPVFVVPPGGGTAIGYRHLAEALGPDRPLAVVEARCLHRRSRVPRSVAAFARDAATVILERCPSGRPVVVVGFSAGGPIAYDVAHRLAAAGIRPHVVLLDTGPTLSGGDDEADEVVVRRRPTRNPVTALRRRLEVRRRWYEWFPGRPRFHVERYRAVQRRSVRAGLVYEPAPAEFPVTLLHVGGSRLPERCAPWIPDLRTVEVPGRHDTVLAPPHVAAVATAVAEVADSEAAVTGADGGG